MRTYDFLAKRNLYKREDGSYYLFSDDLFEAYKADAYEVIAAYNCLAKALVKLEEIDERATDKDYFLGLVVDGCEHIRNEHRQTLERELKNISFFKAKRKELIEDAVEAIPAAIFQTVQRYLDEARKANEGLVPRVTAEYLTVTLADDGSCLWIGLADRYEEDLKKSMTQEVPDERIKDCEALISALEILRGLRDKGANLTGSPMPSGAYVPGIVEALLWKDGEEYRNPLTLEHAATHLGYYPKK